MKNKLKAVLEVSIAELLFFILAWYFQYLFGRKYGWYSKTIMILMGFTGIVLHKRVREYGLIPRSLKFSLKWSVYVTVLFFLTSIITILILTLFGWFRLVELRILIIDLIWFFVLVGFAEELFFRGYIQSRLNEVFNKKYDKIIGIKFKWSQGTLITGIAFFGLPHLLVAFNPFTGQITLTPLVFIITFFACFIGIVLGVIREKTGGIILPSIIHGLIDYTTFSLGKSVNPMISNIITIVALFLFFLLLFEKLLHEEITE